MLKYDLTFFIVARATIFKHLTSYFNHPASCFLPLPSLLRLDIQPFFLYAKCISMIYL